MPKKVAVLMQTRMTIITWCHIVTPLGSFCDKSSQGFLTHRKFYLQYPLTNHSPCVSLADSELHPSPSLTKLRPLENILVTILCPLSETGVQQHILKKINIF